MGQSQHFMDIFFNPRSVAIVGASTNPDRLNYNLVKNLLKFNFPGDVYPVNPSAREILGLKAYPSVKDIQADVDLAVVSVSSNATMDVIRDCVAKGVGAVTIIAGGFSEVGDQGRRTQDEIRDLLGKNSIRAIGPNSLSPINAAKNFAISFNSVERLKQGHLAFVFQSGLYDPRINWMFSEFNLRLSKLIDLGNKMDVNEVDALEYLAHDPETRVIAMHMESIAGDGRKFLKLLKETTREKPVIVLKTGRTEAGVMAASSHTGALAKGSDLVFDAALKQSGAIRAQTLEEFFDLAKAFEFLGSLAGNRIAIATLPGGEAVITADLCQERGFTLAEVAPETREKLRRLFPPWEVAVNPFDIGVCGQFHSHEEVYSVFMRSMADDPHVDCLAVQLRGRDLPGSDEFLQSFLLAKERHKPLAMWVPGGPGGRFDIVDWLEERGIPLYQSADAAIKALAALRTYSIMQGTFQTM